MDDYRILRGLRPFEAKLFASLDLTAEVEEQLAAANDGLGKHGLKLASVERCIWRVICDPRSMPYVSYASERTARKTLCLGCRADERLFVGIAETYASSPGSVWSVLQPFGQGNPETLERKFLAWGEESAIELTDHVTMQATAEELVFLNQLLDSDDRNSELLVFADWLEERGDERADAIRGFARN